MRASIQMVRIDLELPQSQSEITNCLIRVTKEAKCGASTHADAGRS